ncbi:hypothetical protein L1987_35080 [Smallanthus sonchifolius]|uniref:Uncharacterized protein n=1 Tax=Smallanthus sonchifolius TaxID=185202 RepID=A0ACB9HVC1_9ASTR|nr:hypothetical protein L1987_35080 [Smallanthus sonchifolius]
MTRYLTIEEVDAALAQLEEHERTVLTEKVSGEKHMEQEKPTSMSVASGNSLVSGQVIANGVEENGGTHEEASDEDDEINVRQKVMLVDPEEEAEFDREFRALMQESLDSGNWSCGPGQH